MNTDDVRVMLTLLKSIDDSLKQCRYHRFLLPCPLCPRQSIKKRKPKKNKHKPPAPSYMDK